MNRPTLATLVVVGVLALVMVNSAPVVHAQSTFPVPPPPTTPIVPVPPQVQPPLPPSFAQPFENNGTNVLGPNDNGKQILNQENQCTGTPKNVNQAPIANAGPDQTITPLLGTTVTLDGTASFATTVGATIVSYSWVQTSGTSVTLNGATIATPSFAAPTVSTSTSLTFSLTVIDSNGAVSAPDSVTITLNPSTSNQPPIANAGLNQLVAQGSIVTLSGTGSFAQNGATTVSYSWVQISGAAVSLNGANTVTPTFTAPTVNGTLAFSLTITDSRGAVSSPATVSVTVT